MLKTLQKHPWNRILFSLLGILLFWSINTQPVQAQTPNADLPRLDGEATVVMTLAGSGDSITMRIRGDKAPITAGNFIDLIDKGIYDSTVFHRVVREPQPFVVQGGDPQSVDPSFPAARLGTGGYIDPLTGKERTIPLEFSVVGADAPIYERTLRRRELPSLRHKRGAVAMARSNRPNSASSQFYIALQELDFLNGNYAVFGEVTAGMDVVDQIQQGDRIATITVTSGITNLIRP
ncbi:MAG: peptidylprolyl isomerase [Spirulina sp. SIO3F2]|nr:peptidylprolyl isomerase [Spirulina sp. SIO3F2]